MVRASLLEQELAHYRFGTPIEVSWSENSMDMMPGSVPSLGTTHISVPVAVTEVSYTVTYAAAGISLQSFEVTRKKFAA